MSRLSMLCQLREDASAIFCAGVHAVDADQAVKRHVRLDVPAGLLHLSTGESLLLSQFKRVFVVGAGKAAAPMACALEQLIGGAFEPQGTINVKYGHTSPRPRFIRLHEAGHPLPDAAGVE